jgi:predicted N-acetyltransferase YhbS
VTDAAVRIRPFRPGDLPALHAVREAAFAPVFAGLRARLGPEIAPVALAAAEDEQAALLDRICADGSDAAVLVAEADGTVVGFVAFSVDAASRVGEIGLNAVRPDRAGRGLGTGLYAAALAAMRARGAVVATVSTGGDAAHAPARRAYEKAGFGPSIPSLHLYRTLGP